MPPISIDILGVPVHAQRFDDAIRQLIAWIEGGDSRYSESRCVCTCTVYTVMQAGEDARIMDALRHADMITADGMPLVWLQRCWGASFAERVYGPDLMLALCEKTSSSNVRHYFLGGSPETTAQLSTKLREKFPNLHIVGTLSPLVVDPLTIDETVVSAVIAARPNVIWVGLGSPKQDLFMHTYRAAFPNALMIGVGAAFDFLAGKKAQAPVWIQRVGMEWAFRLLQEPRRLAKRYLWYNPRFMIAVARQAVALKR